MSYNKDNNFPVEFPNPFAHFHVIGRKETGKKLLIAEKLLDDIYNSEGAALFDAYGSVTELVLPRIPKERWGDVVLIEPHTQRNYPVAYNPFFNIKEDGRSKFVSENKLTLKSIWDYIGFPTPTMDDTITNSVSAVLETDQPTLVALKWFLSSKKYRKRVVNNLKDKIIKDYWESEFESLSPKQQTDDTKSTLTKIRAFTSDPVTRNILGQPISKIDLKDILKTNKILIVNLPIGEMGTEATKLLGSLLAADFHNAALSRTGKLSPVNCYIYGCHRFAYSIQVEMLDTPEQHQVSYLFAHEYLDQLDPKFRQSLLGSAGNIVSFATGVLDEEKLGVLFPKDLVFSTLFELPPYEMCIRKHGQGNIFRETLHKLTYPNEKGAKKGIRNKTQNKYTTGRKDVEKALNRFVKIASTGGDK